MYYFEGWNGNCRKIHCCGRDRNRWPSLALEEVLKDAGLTRDDIACTIATGYGRKLFEEAEGEVSELSCHARGVHFVFPDVHTVIDIGGQDAKVLSLNEKGRMMNFVMNDKCAAGTGRFLDVMANILKLDISQLEVEAAKSENPASISSTCTVFAESEVISQLAGKEQIFRIWWQAFASP